MSLLKSATVQIEQVGNGFIVRPGNDVSRAGECFALADLRVFQTFAELCQFLGEHFTLRASGITPDK